ncbi:uncharacterized protein LOC106052509 isoform X2 [Biomphalaria glabrata]|uniref:Uncharacterized protein LOC106052509 isoform X2 n=1 Tax=Biomphalaria glabrata TaxID=6526 RepID=A0A9W3BFT9_BIOGL|nr:uncharacterized protein LOC106052509 isoform X2 [Biomphalaria glabrata]
MVRSKMKNCMGQENKKMLRDLSSIIFGARMSIQMAKDEIKEICTENENLEVKDHYIGNETASALSDVEMEDDGLDEIYGEHEIQECECQEETNFSQYFQHCDKDHNKYISIDEFSLEHLPKALSDSIFYDYIKFIADLTVRVDVKMTSPRRPEVWQRTKNVKYPSYDLRGKTNLRTGTGIVSLIYRFTNGIRNSGGRYEKKHTKCWCRKCQHSEIPSSMWWEFDVDTASHVVFDETEADNTSVLLFYDRKESQNVIVDTVTFKYSEVCNYNDRCYLQCVTCDESLGKKLDTVWKQFHRKFSTTALTNYINSTRVLENFMFIVSHPHGSPKMISIGQWKDKIHKTSGQFQFTYTASTCRGSSGACVVCLGYTGLLSHLTHRGTRTNLRLNHSGTGHFLKYKV